MICYNNFILMKRGYTNDSYNNIICTNSYNICISFICNSTNKISRDKCKRLLELIEANQMLDKLYRFAKKYERLSSQEQLVFLEEAEKVFDAFGKVPDMLWEDEYQKYMDVLDKYKDIKVTRWSQN